ncbi:hypothetical protein N7447_005655 [Penicillium robsamsonii]|uniref:uncharacterized protein n=1 Tax=Penicillium robsamsonii TaxID=1792511 RepID=UPI0025470A51|nr:uncharacterized protein N7447_005655 [Penicillium robsamsonii]KAJ5823315.1 hypothetical protein N7447_005655 [Penicillium robsamsonii]
MGTLEAAHCATAVSQQFPNVRLALMVGIGAGIPGLPKRGIRLGDLAVSIPQDGHSGVIQYDFVKYEQGRELVKRHPLKRVILSITKNQGFERPHKDDILFDESFFHVNKGSDCSECEAAGSDHVIPREPRRDHQPVVHRGLIISGNGVVKNPQEQRSLKRDQTDAICFEMEAAGIIDENPCLIVRGICDYADTSAFSIYHFEIF